MVDVAPPGAMLEVRARALLTHLSLADSAPSLTFACEMVRRSLYAEARATSLLGLEPARANKMHKSNAVRSMSPQVVTHHSHRGTAHSHRSMHARVAQPCRGTRCRVCRQPSAVLYACHSQCCVRAWRLVGLGRRLRLLPLDLASSRSPATRVRSVPPFHGVLALRERHPLH